MKRVLFILIPAFTLAVIVYLVLQLLFGARNEKGALQVTSSPQSKVYLDGQLIGITPLCRCEGTTMLPVGDHMLKLVPNDSQAYEFQEKVTIVTSVLTVIDRTFGKGSLSEGSMISLNKLPTDKETQLVIVSIPSQAEVYVDDTPNGTTPILLKDLTDSDHTVKLRKEGYKEKIIRVHTPAGYKLLLTMSLGVSDVTVSPTLSPSASASASITVTPVSTPKIIILDTPTGFLRVRSQNATTAPEVARVTPGETFPLVTEHNGWYQIKLTSGTLGWISSQYARKQ